MKYLENMIEKLPDFLVPKRILIRKKYKKLQGVANKSFKESKNYIKNYFGLDLSLIELIELKQCVEHASKIYLDDKTIYEGKDTGFEINPYIEASWIFMNENYGAQIYNLKDWNNFDWRRMIAEEELGFDYYAEGFKKMQDEMHNRIGY